uniref:tRNA (guanine-N(7)-)-methyltransferase n=2 Tax=Micromonas pusilla TaxID=38833 RepID=A0A6U0J4P5_MICPS|mmetsp:Transcript_5217/g.18723  ORF Transcript_5217/g.18723 Transcript_5217/m.18723 type:complete len:253 (+) Transcript_5217:422-1180(+)
MQDNAAVNNQDNALPRKKFYRARAHCNPLSDSHIPTPIKPQEYKWEREYREFLSASIHANSAEKPLVQFADVGCGFGGLLIRLAQLFPRNLVVGFEIRDKVSQFVRRRCLALRQEQPGRYDNISCVRSNTMKNLANFMRKGQLTKLFFLFPDPHFKVANHRRRIIQSSLLAEFAYTLAIGGRVYTVTDVAELASWMTAKINSQPCFERVSTEDLEEDPVVPLLISSTEEGRKVERNHGCTFVFVFRRIEGPK